MDVETSSLVAVLGPSGCGKTTLLRILCGLDYATGGTVEIGDANPQQMRRTGRIGMALQEPALLPWRNVIRNISLSLELRSHEVQAHRANVVTELTELFKISGADNLFPSQLSGGMAQRVAVARALASRPQVLLLDEPFGALDWFLRRQIIEDFQYVWLATRPTTVFVTHETREAVFLADHIVIMSQRPGRVIASLAVSFPRPRPKHLFSDRLFHELCDRVDALCATSYE